MKRFLLLLLLLAALWLAWQVEQNTGHLNNLQQAAPALAAFSAQKSPANGERIRYIVTGSPTISAALINLVLAAYRSPAANTGQALYSLGVRYGIDPVYALAFFMHESLFGRYGMATATRSLGNLRCIAGFPCYQGYAAFSSWQAGYAAWYKLIRSLYVDTWHLRTVAAIIPTYAPAADHNAPGAYITAVERAVDAWRAGKVEVEP